VLFACLQVGFFAMNVVLGAQLMGQLKPWPVIAANLLAAASMSLYQWKRHPRIRQSLEHVWDSED
jgi:purine-cytosine permease-like protein